MPSKTQNSRKSVRKSQNKSVRQAQDKKHLGVVVASQMLVLATSGFGLVAALAWNNVIQELVNNYVKKFLPGGSGLTSLLIYAIVVTILAVTVTYQLSAIKEGLEK